MSDATLLITERFAALWAWEMLLLRGIWRFRAEFSKLINTKSIGNCEACFEVSGGGGGDVLSSGFNSERAVNTRAPFGWATADEVKEISIGGRAII